jgi:hypothetical protein
MPYPRIHEPALEEWELDSSSSRYDYPKAWPSRKQLHIEFSILSTVNAVTATAVGLLIIALVRYQRRARAQGTNSSFNTYLLFIAMPDFMVSFLCCLTCALSAPQNEFYAEWLCGFQSFYLNWAFISNAWLNGVIVYQIHTMLRHSHVRRRYRPPTERRVGIHAAIVYTYALAWGLACGFNLRFLPHSSHLYYGFACMPMEYNTASTLFFWLVYLPFSLGIPVCFAAYVVFDIWCHKLLPPTGKRRRLSMFLLRLAVLYFAVWLPFLILFLVGNFVVINPFIHWIGAVISHLQGLLSAMFCLTNAEIGRSFVEVVSCGQCTKSGEGGGLEHNSTSLRKSGGSARERSRNSAGHGGQAQLSGLDRSSELGGSSRFLVARIHRWSHRGSTKELHQGNTPSSKESQDSNGSPPLLETTLEEGSPMGDDETGEKEDGLVGVNEGNEGNENGVAHENGVGIGIVDGNATDLNGGDDDNDMDDDDYYSGDKHHEHEMVEMARKLDLP